jgi:hypothetical protein
VKHDESINTALPISSVATLASMQMSQPQFLDRCGESLLLEEPNPEEVGCLKGIAVDPNDRDL